MPPKRTQKLNRNPKRLAPRPLIDSLSVLSDRQQREALITALPQRLVVDVPSGADKEFGVVLNYLRNYDGSSATFNAYRRELERLLHWSWCVRGGLVRGLGREDIVAFVKFTLDPPRAWIGTKTVARFVQRDGQREPNPAWRPFVASVSKSKFRAGAEGNPADYNPSQASIRATFRVLSSFFDYLVQESLVAANPVALVRQKNQFIRRDHDLAPVRRISDLQWDYVLETAELMAQDSPEIHERTLFVMTALFAMYLRISELVADERAAPVMGDFRKDRDGHWWFHVTGKGNKRRTVTVSDAMLKALKRYRKARGLSSLPSPNESTPLVPKTRGKGPITSSRWIRSIVQDCFDRAFERMQADGLGDDAQDLRDATVHWLRHTGISEDIRTRPREHVRDDAGHASLATTDRYIESDQRERHESGQKKPTKLFE